MTVKMIKRNKNIKEMNEEHKNSLHHIDKKKVNLKAAEGNGGGTGDLGASFTPDDEELAQINQFTKKTVSADEVVAFNLMSCNDMYDRDDERFTPDTISEFKALEQPYSFTGKSFMADHDYQMAKVRGRIFDTDSTSEEGVNFLTNKVYVPKTAQYADYIENLDFGLAWAVSVGVVVDKANCSICESPVYQGMFGSWCQEGHDKGYFYVPGEEEDDGWGYFLPVDPSTKGAVKAMVDLSDPIDGYEISQVILGAQYNAQLGKNPNYKGFVKAASAKSIPIIGLSRKDVEDLDLQMPEEDEAVTEARKQYTVVADADGDPTWTDDSGLMWVYTTNEDTNTSEVMCLGRKEVDSDGQEGVLDGGTSPGEELRPDGEALEVSGAEPDSEPGSEGGEEPGSTPGSPDPDEGQREVENPDDNKEKTVSKKSLVAGLRAAKLPTSLVDKIEGTEGDDLPTLLAVVGEHIAAQTKSIDELTPRAELGDTYLKDLRADVLHYYVVARTEEPGKPVSTTQFSKILDAVGTDIDVLKELLEENRASARVKYPTARVASAFEKAPEEVEPAEEATEVAPGVASEPNRKFAERIHR